ncbi:hypothetical protein CRM22_010309 [Opisthorchis felineus]|uniref:Serine hydroxymethyltransferase n=1 Tax=Opisthorchis felineus TaxID=147828 RepID=A0A4V3SC75_OPIFE|nr:hypothetical protein CRM22_010309 [Opisthorchis felineus]
MRTVRQPISRVRNTRFSSWTGKEPLKVKDPALWTLISEEKKRQLTCLELIASQNFAGRSVLECVGSCLTNNYAEGYPGSRYYGGNYIIDKVERLAQSRLLDLFRLKKPEQSLEEAAWGVNVQPYSGSPANLAVYTGLLNPHDRLMGLYLPDGGHLTHGFATLTKKISATSIFFESMPYKLHPETELIDYDALQRDALNFYPKLIIAGITAYPRLLDYARFRHICDSVGAILLADMSHISGLVAGRVVPSPFEYADVVSSTTHKTLRGPRSGMIFYRRTSRQTSEKLAVSPHVAAEELESRINNAVFPSLQGGPHENTIAGVAAMALEADSQDFADYAEQVLKNARALGEALQSRGIRLVSGGTDVHFVLVDLARSPGKPGLSRGDGARVQLVSDLVGITLNKNTVLGDKSALQPSGLRLGSPALTSRGLKEEDFKQVAAFLEELLDITVLAKSVSQNIKTFRTALVEDPKVSARVKELRGRVSEYASQFPMPGWDDY